MDTEWDYDVDEDLEDGFFWYEPASGNYRDWD